MRSYAHVLVGTPDGGNHASVCTHIITSSQYDVLRSMIADRNTILKSHFA